MASEATAQQGLVLTAGAGVTSAAMVSLDDLTGTPFAGVGELLVDTFAGGVALQHEFDELTVHTEAALVAEVMQVLRDGAPARFEVLVDVCGVDIPEREARFGVVYHLLSPSHNLRVRVKIAVSEHEAVPSMVELFPAAQWFEREAYDLYGILFSGHPDLRRILTDYGFDGHPLRKDFPLSGFTEVRYDPSEGAVVSTPIALVQEYRKFDTLNPWMDGADSGNRQAKAEPDETDNSDK